jgi:hypothetical protein
LPEIKAGQSMGEERRKDWYRHAPETGAGKPEAVDKDHGWRVLVQHEIDGLLQELAAFNARIVELEKLGHQGHALNILKAKAVSLAGQIDELRCLLIVPKH